MRVRLPSRKDYLHWDELRRRPLPDGLNHREWWMLVKMARMEALKPIPLLDKKKESFLFAVPELILETLHRIDFELGGVSAVSEPIANPHTRDRYAVSSLMEEAITSSQLEGAVTTRDVARELIRTGRKPRDISERMILNNFITMGAIRKMKDSRLSPELVFETHRMVTRETLDDPTGAGRFRREEEKRIVGDAEGNIYHEPPTASELAGRMDAMCAFANGETPDFFVHPVIRAILLHFWLAYDHPFVDGNGRTARALFYWAMLSQGYWLFEFLSISSILRKAPVRYVRSFLYTETDENDLTYFIVDQMDVIRQAIAGLRAYIDRKASEIRDMENHLRGLDLFNHRQAALIQHALTHSGQRYTFRSHQKSHNVAYQTARTDLLRLGECGLLEQRKKGNQTVFLSPADLSDRLLTLEKEERAAL